MQHALGQDAGAMHGVVYFSNCGGMLINKRIFSLALVMGEMHA
jgi:hypothetical protein